MKILAFPRDPNPYQEQLYGYMRAAGNDVRYVGESTSSHTLNLLLMPIALVFFRIRGFRLLHLHWTFAFVPAWAGPKSNQLWRLWYELILFWCKLLGYKLAWTAHNVLPHNKVFRDDINARRTLVRRCDLIIAMNNTVARKVAELFRPEILPITIPHGNYDQAYPAPRPRAAVRASLGLDSDVFLLLFFGAVEEYKGVVELARTVSDVELAGSLTLLIAGRCPDITLKSTLLDIAAASPTEIRTRFERIPDSEVSDLMTAADLVVFPFRKISTSGSLILAMGFSAVCLIPDDDALADIPSDAAERYRKGDSQDLKRRIAELVEMPESARHATGAAARRYIDGLSFDKIASKYMTSFSRLLCQ